jgi:meiotic recombination protein REC8, fungi type
MDLLDWDLDVVFQSQMSSANKYSQFTPLGSQHSISSGMHASNVSINLPDSSHGSIRMPSDFGQLSPFKPFQLQGPDGSDHNPFGDDDLGGVALDIDADGNVIGIFGEEPELPPLPTPSAAHGEINLPGAQAHHVLQSEDQPFIMNEELILPDAEAFPRTQPAPQQRQAHTISETQSSEVEQGAAPSRRGRRRKANVMFDARDCLSSREMREMRDSYLEHMDEQRKKRKTRGAPYAKQNAQALLYGNGIANVGIFLDFDTQLEHPLAGQFAGNTLMESLLGIDMSGDKRKAKGRRRGRSAAFSDDEEDEQRVEKQQKLDVAEVEQFLHGSDGHPSFADDTAPELGLEAGGALDDRHSSTMMPWSRAGSVVPGSSVRGSAKKPSPMPGRAGSIIHSVERYSDIGDAAFGSDGHFPPNGS